MSALIATVLPMLIAFAFLCLPMGLVVAAVMYMQRQEKQTARRSPLNDKLVHQAGAQARMQVDALNDAIQERVVLALLIGPFAMLVILLPRVHWSRLVFGWVDWLVIAVALFCVGLVIRSLVRLRGVRNQWRDGHLGELATAQALNKLTAHGCVVFHDLPTGRANIDHIVVAPKAVFAVETKWRSKGAGKAGATVHYDGKRLRFPGHQTDQPLEQVRGLAHWLAKYLHGETGLPVRVVPAVALPGWWVELGQGAADSDVKVINEKWQKTFLDIAGPEIAPDQRTRIVHAITKQYPDLNGDAA